MAGKHFLSLSKVLMYMVVFKEVAKESINRAFAILLEKEDKLPECFDGRFLFKDNEMTDDVVFMLPFSSIKVDEVKKIQ